MAKEKNSKLMTHYEKEESRHHKAEEHEEEVHEKREKKDIKDMAKTKPKSKKKK